MRYWDSSAIIPLLVEEPASPKVRLVLKEDSNVVSWWGTPVECASALWRLKRQGLLADSDFSYIRKNLDELMAEIDVVPPSPWLKDRALRILAVHPLRSGDSLQLAAALRWTQEQTRGAGFVSLDDRLRSTALSEGFSVYPA